MRPPALECRGLHVGYDARPVLSGVDVAVAHDEVLAVLGPSGSGKTTLLSTVAGFVDPRQGEVLLAGREVASPRASVPPEAREVAVVFQHYALWPHLSAVETVAYPLRRQGVGGDAARRRALELLELMGIAELADRRPAELSGGQQQRVGLARALARAPSLYLFDEPTAHLDAALRGTLQAELAEQRRAAGAAALYATHDAGEALAVADRVVILRDGVVLQSGTPSQVYGEPVDVWAARLTGPASILEVRIEAVDLAARRLRLTVAGEVVEIELGAHAPRSPGAAQLLARPDWAGLGGPLTGVARQVAYRGPHTDYRLDTPAGEMIVREPGGPRVRAGERVSWTLRRGWPVSPALS